MRPLFKSKSFLFFLLTIVVNGLLISCTGNSSDTDKTVEIQKSKSGQIYQWSEAEGKEFLSQIRQNITTPKAWKMRAKRIRSQILKGAGLEPFPDKCPLNPIFGKKRIFDGYQVENV
ncbi:MAG: hypothetical protein KAI29_07850, partial [Cyclobacteriaceae bacterium]|nr:hypothetical protein [Cyclobacteriaceae bacterium]